MNQYDQSRIWQKNLGIQLNSDLYLKQREFLRFEYEKFRERSSLVAAEIARDLPHFTVHDISHIDALWSLTDLIVPEEYFLTPAEVFILGGAFLIHDLGLGLAAYPDGISKLKEGNLWTDSISYYYKLYEKRAPTENEIINPSVDIEKKALENILRLLHAKHAETLALTKWRAVNQADEFYFLIDNKDLRDAYGNIIGQIAHSHWWTVEQISKKFTTKLGAPGILPQTWTVDPLKIALILRIADGAHVDDRRAPGFLRALRKSTGFSDQHWNFQQKLYQPRVEAARFVYTSKMPFTIDESNSWWLCYDTLKLLDNELKEVDSLLAETNRQRLNVIAIAGIEDPLRFSTLINAKDWQPVNTEIKVGDVAQLVTRLGGSELYGKDLTVPLRELIQNSADAIKARRVLEDENEDWGDIIIRRGEDNNGMFLEVEDTGVGMSLRVLTGPLLDFGQSFWGTPLMHEELPGLESKNFNATGKYGIGFYSIFMISEKVSVFTRRYEDARENTWCLEFASGVKGRPILRKALNEETIKQGGTRIRVYISPSILNKILLYKKKTREIWTLNDRISKICISLDVNVFYQENNNVEKSLIKANDWIKIPALDLIKRITGRTNFANSGKRTQQLLKNFANNLEIIKEGNTVVARACIFKDMHYLADMPDTDAIITVNGLKADSLQSMTGVFSGTNLKASRDSATPILSNFSLKEWANNQAKKVSECVFINKFAQEDIASIIWRLGGDTQNLPIARHNKQWINYSELVEILKVRKVPIYLLDNYFVNNIEDNFKDVLEIYDNVIEVDSSFYPILNSYRRINNDEIWPPELKYSSRIYQTLVGCIIKAFAEAWDIDEERIVDYYSTTDDKYQEVIIGRIDGKDIYEMTNVIDLDLINKEN